jgi:hypothetical protein
MHGLLNVKSYVSVLSCASFVAPQTKWAWFHVETLQFLWRYERSLLPVPSYQQRHNSDAPHLALTCLWCRSVPASDALLFVALRTRFWKQSLKCL